MLEHFGGGRANRRNHHAAECEPKSRFTIQLIGDAQQIDRLMGTRKQQTIAFAADDRLNIIDERLSVLRQIPLVDSDGSDFCTASFEASHQRMIRDAVFL